MRVGLRTAPHDLNRLHGLIVVDLDLGQVASDGEPLPIARVVDALVLILGVEHDLLAAVVHEVTPAHDRPVDQRPEQNFVLFTLPSEPRHWETCLRLLFGHRGFLGVKLIQNLVKLRGENFDRAILETACE